MTMQRTYVPLVAQPRSMAEPSEREARDSGPWLAITGPVIIALTVIVVAYLSKISF